MRHGSGRLAGLDGLRGLAALAIVGLHVWMYTGAKAPGRWPLLDAVIGELRLGVPLFFVLSGFLLARPWVRAALEGARRPRTRAFLAKRAARVLPGYWAAVAGAFVLLHGVGHPYAIGPAQLPIFAVMAHTHVPSTLNRLDPPMWSMPVETAFYLLLPAAGALLVALARRTAGTGTGTRTIIGARARALLVALAFALAGFAWCALGELLRWPPTVMTSLPTWLPVFACGVGAAVLVHGRRPGTTATAALLILGAALVVGDGVWHHDGTGLGGHVVRDTPAAAGLAAIVAAVAARPRSVLDAAPLRALGTVSYGLYLWHMPVVYAYVMDGGLPRNPAAAFGAVLAPTLVLAALSWHVVEKRFVGAPRRAAGAKARRVSMAGAP